MKLNMAEEFESLRASSRGAAADLERPTIYALGAFAFLMNAFKVPMPMPDVAPAKTAVIPDGPVALNVALEARTALMATIMALAQIGLSCAILYKP